MSTVDTLSKAIDERNAVAFSHAGRDFVVEPHILFLRHEGGLVLRGWTIQPSLRWGDFPVSEIRECTVKSDERFTPRSGFNKFSQEYVWNFRSV